MFPKHFYWGASTASYQVEGGNDNTDWAAAARAGRVPECGRACDHYHRFEADFDIAKELGHNAHRFSIEWARIEPEEGMFDEREIAHYREVLQALQERGITPFVTLWHFTLPEWFAKSGGFERDDAPEIFARYCEYVVSELSDLCDHFSTINEPNVYASLGWLKGLWPPFERFGFIGMFKTVTESGDLTKARPKTRLLAPLSYYRISKSLANSHNRAYERIKSTHTNVNVSIVKHTVAFDSDGNPFNSFLARISNYLWTGWFMNRVQNHLDAIGLNYYHYTKYGDRDEHEKTDMGWDMQPSHIYDAIMILARYQKPIYVTEAGLADDDDSHRAWYIKEQVSGVACAIADGADVRSHMYWSLLDNYEWAFGFGKRFGLVAIDCETLERTVRPSAWEYKKLIEANSSVDAVE